MPREHETQLKVNMGRRSSRSPYHPDVSASQGHTAWSPQDSTQGREQGTTAVEAAASEHKSWAESW